MDKKRTTSSFRAMSTERKLESIFLFVTGRCNAKCAMCFYAQEMDKKQPDLTFDEIKKISETAGQFNRLWISGGEPTLREDLPEILELFYKNNHIKDVNIPTNGLKPGRALSFLQNLTLHRMRSVAFLQDSTTRPARGPIFLQDSTAHPTRAPYFSKIRPRTRREVPHFSKIRPRTRRGRDIWEIFNPRISGSSPIPIGTQPSHPSIPRA